MTLDALYNWFDENRENIMQKGFITGEFLIQDCITEAEEIIFYFPWGGAVRA
ncbi:MAG: hypothetical protein LBU17_02025 [Treponema sp.]|jgi:hypothetical protein|nr:hypothetical protein [Treponema sp.]